MFCKKLFIISMIVILRVSATRSQIKRDISSRDKRESLTPPPLVYPFGATLKLLFGCTVPIAMPGRILVYGQNFQFQFAMPQNATFFSNYFGDANKQATRRQLLRRKRRRRRRRDAQATLATERSVLYRLLEEELSRRGGPGKDCLKRSICEYAESPMRDEGLVGEIFHVLLTPDYGGSSQVDEEYVKAAEVGRRGGDCLEAYASCPDGFGLLDRITSLI